MRPLFELFGVFAGATESDMLTFKEWMGRPPPGLRNFLGFHEDDDGDCGESLGDWTRNYHADLAAAGLAVPGVRDLQRL